MEHELKYVLADQEAYERLALALVSQEFLAHLTRRKSEQIQMHTRYLDTKEAALRSLGLGLRIRKENERLVLNLKGPARQEGALSVREEWEGEISKEQEERLLGQGSWPAVLADVFAGFEGEARKALEALGDRVLSPICSVRFCRKSCLLFSEDESLVFELALDQGRFERGEATRDFQEFELELKRGEEADLRALAAACEAFGTPCSESKFARALAL